MASEPWPRVAGENAPLPPVVVVEQRGDRAAVAGFVCGLLSVIVGLIPFLAPATLTLAVLGIVFSRRAWSRMKAEPVRGLKRLALAGLILSGIGLLLAIVGVVVMDMWVDRLEPDIPPSG